jgi:hypothetical protein
MNLATTQLKDTYGNLLTIGTSAGSPQTGTLQNGDGQDITALTLGGDLIVQGTQSADLFLQDTGATDGVFKLKVNGDIFSVQTSNDSYGFVADVFQIDRGANEANLKIHDGGDISFRDTSSNEAFYWDASAGSLGIGISPSKKLTVFGTGAGNATVQIEGEGGADPYINFLANNTQHWSLGIDDSDSDKFKLSEHSALGTNDYLVVETSGNVGIGISPVRTLHVDGGSISSDTPTLRISSTDSSGTNKFGIEFFSNSGSDVRGKLLADNNGKVYLDDNGGGGVILQGNGGTGGVGIGGSPSTFANYTNVSIKGGSSGSNLDFLNSSGTRVGAIVSNPSTDFIIETNEATPLVFKTNSNPAMTIDSSGRVGIGETNPDRELDLKNSADNCVMSITSSASHLSGLVLGDTDDDDRGGILYNNTSDYLYFLSNAQERMRILSGGDVSLAMQDFSASPSSTNYGLRLITGATGKTYWKSAVNADTTHFHYEFLNTNGSVGSIQTSGSATSYVTSSDYRLKENVVAMTGALDRVDQLKPSRFNFIADADTTVDGFLAHEVAEIVPEAISGEKDAVDEEGNPIYQGIDQSKLVPLLVGAIQELRAEIEQLKNQ